MEKLEIPYKILSQDGILEDRTLVIESRIEQFKNDPEIPNPTADENAYFYGIAVNGAREQVQTFQPGEDGTEPMTKQEAEEYLSQDIEQQKANYGIK
jgi:hypothetical protein